MRRRAYPDLTGLTSGAAFCRRFAAGAGWFEGNSTSSTFSSESKAADRSVRSTRALLSGLEFGWRKQECVGASLPTLAKNARMGHPLTSTACFLSRWCVAVITAF
jgi:hypothetical protein